MTPKVPTMPMTDAQIDAEFADHPQFVRSYLKGLEEFFRTEIWPGEAGEPEENGDA